MAAAVAVVIARQYLSCCGDGGFDGIPVLQRCGPVRTPYRHCGTLKSWRVFCACVACVKSKPVNEEARARARGRAQVGTPSGRGATCSSACGTCTGRRTCGRTPTTSAPPASPRTSPTTTSKAPGPDTGTPSPSTPCSPAVSHCDSCGTFKGSTTKEHPAPLILAAAAAAPAAIGLDHRAGESPEMAAVPAGAAAALLVVPPDAAVPCNVAAVAANDC